MLELNFNLHDLRTIDSCVDHVRSKLDVDVDVSPSVHELVVATVQFVKTGAMLPALFSANGHPPCRLNVWSRAILNCTVDRLFREHYATTDDVLDRRLWRLWRFRLDLPHELVMAS